MRTRSDEGFTLVELLVVVIVIGILASIAVPTYLGQRQKGYRATAVSDMKNVTLALENWAARSENNGSYAGLDGATQDSPELDGEGYNKSAFISLEVHVNAANEYCIEGEHEKFPGQTFRFRNTDGVTDIVDPEDACT